MTTLRRRRTLFLFFFFPHRPLPPPPSSLNLIFIKQEADEAGEATVGFFHELA